MTNSKALRAAIIVSSYKIPDLAAKLGISVQSLYNKINNKTEFLASEIDAICETLCLNVEQRMNIFFHQN